MKTSKDNITDLNRAPEAHETVHQSDGILTLHLPPVKLPTAGSSIMKLGKDEIKRLIQPLKIALEGKTLAFTPKSDKNIVNSIKSINDSFFYNRILKEDLAKLYVSFSSDINNIRNMAMSDLKIRQTWELILYSTEVSSGKIKELLGRDIVFQTPHYWGSDIYVECLFSPVTIYNVQTIYKSYYSREGEQVYTVSILPERRAEAIKSFYGTQPITPEITEELPDKKDLLVEDFENDMSADLMILEGIGMSGNPLSSSTGTLTAAKLKSIKKAFHTNEFAPASKSWPLDRIEMLVNAFFLRGMTEKKVDKATDPGKFARYIVKGLPLSLKPGHFGVLLPAFKGFTKTWADQSNADSVARITGDLIAPSANGWMSLSNLRLRYLCSDTSRWDIDPYFHLFPERARNRHTLKRKDEDTDTYTYSKNINWFKEIDFPFVIHWIKLLCAVGILEIAQNKDRGKDNTDILEGLRYVRLTSLGRYAYGIDKSYTPSANKSVCDIDFDETNCILTILNESCPYSFFLRQISTPIGDTRFRITPKSLLQGCESHSDLQECIGNLKKILDVDKSPMLKSIINEAESRVGCMHKINDNYILLKLKPDVPGLIELISTNKEIRSKLLFAEKSIILVKADFFQRLKTLCKANGYLLD